MKRAIAIVILSLYLYNFVGYLALFAFLQYRVRADMKTKIKSSVPESELVLLAFPSQALEEGSCALQWLDDHEFRYDGNMYDIVGVHLRADSTFFLCLNDTQEEKLFEDLDLHVQRQMANSGQLDKLDAFKDVFSHSLAPSTATLRNPDVRGVVPNSFAEHYRSIHPDTPFHPPRNS